MHMHQVVQVQHRQTGVRYALKVVDKHLVLRHKQAANIRNERNLLDRLDDAGIVQLHFTFQDAANLYLGLDLCPNGDPPHQHKARISQGQQERAHHVAAWLQASSMSRSSRKAPLQWKRHASMRLRLSWCWSTFASSRCMVSVHVWQLAEKF